MVKPVPADQVFRFRHMAELDGFRGIAVLFVIIGRYWEFRAPSAQLRFLAQHTAQLGVLLFFVLSGFLITGLLHRERSLTGSISFKRFYIRGPQAFASHPAVPLRRFSVGATGAGG